MPSTPSPSWRSPSIAAAPRRRRWSPSAASRSPRPPAGWTPRFAPTSAAGRWSSGSAPNTTRCPRSATPAATTSSPRRRSAPALALAEVADDLGLTVVAARHPAEEAGGGKVLHAGGRRVRRHRRGGDAAPRPGRHRRGARSLALSAGRRSTTAAGKPTRPSRRTWASTPPTRSPSRRWRSGCCASSWRRDSWCTASSPTAGRRANVIPAHAELQYTMRAVDAGSLRELEARMCATASLAGALATGCEYEVDETAPAYDELTPDQWLADVFRAEMERLGREPVAERVRGGAADGQHRHGQRHPGACRASTRSSASTPGAHRSTSRRSPTAAAGPSADTRGRRGRDHVGAHRGSSWPRRPRSATGCSTRRSAGAAWRS